MSKNRVQGRYWVRYKGCWYIGEWITEGYIRGWWDIPEFIFSTGNYDSDFEIINERPILTPND